MKIAMTVGGLASRTWRSRSLTVAIQFAFVVVNHTGNGVGATRYRRRITAIVGSRTGLVAGTSRRAANQSASGLASDEHQALRNSSKMNGNACPNR
jgi:hypothetical protein